MNSNALVKDSTLRQHAQDFQDKADKIVKVTPEWVTGDPQERRAEYLELRDYFLGLVEGR